MIGRLLLRHPFLNQLLVVLDVLSVDEALHAFSPRMRRNQGNLRTFTLESSKFSYST